MRRRLGWAVALVMGLVAVVPVDAQTAAIPHTERPRIRAVQRAGNVSIDGRIVEDAWNAAPVATDFRQQDPQEGQPATQRTEVRIMYDNDAVYIAARMFDDHPVRTRLGRRDEQPEGDNVLFVLDTFHDHTGRTLLWINPSGVRADAGQASPFADPSWDPVWDLATNIDSLGWSAELRIPLSQLRFRAADVQTWGMQVWRFVERLNEVSMWSFWGKTENGGPALFGHVEDLKLPARNVGIELLPYMVARAERVEQRQPGSPFDSGETNKARLGGDVKAILGSSLTIDATINPDFGQVEVDPAVVNLSAFETFFPEKRPFFIEGSGLFGFGGFSCYFCSNMSGMTLFYSRRIGRRPQGSVSGARYVSIPENTTILGAAKLTGRTANGWQIGLVNALTGSETARAETATLERFEQEVEPMTNYLVARVRRNLRNGNLQVGAIGTSVMRRFEADALRTLLPGHAEAVGVDWQALWGNRTYNFMGQIAFTNVSGDSLSMRRIQRAPARYFHRPDRDVRDNGLLTNGYDTSLESLRGLGFYSRVGKQQGDWQWEVQTNIRTPAFEANDIAFLTRADYAMVNGNVRWQETTPTKHYRFLAATVGGQRQYNFDGDLTEAQLHGSLNAQLANYWGVGGFVIRFPERADDAATRGGPVVHRTGGTFMSSNVSTDQRRTLVLSADIGHFRGADSARQYNTGMNMRFKPVTNVSMSVGPSFNVTQTRAQFVDRFNDPSATHFHNQRVVFGKLDQRTLAVNTRVSATFTPTLTLELFAQPFISSGEYEDFREFVATRTVEKRVFDSTQIRAVTAASGRDSVYILDPDRNPATANFVFRNPDFNVRSLRGNAVLRWEYRPGSTLFLVWQQQRANSQPFGDFDLSRDVEGIFNARADNIFLLKMSYWFGR